jgi:ATP-dependent DNA ligase
MKVTEPKVDIRFIKERIDEHGNAEKDPFTGLPMVNGGTIPVIVDVAKRDIRNYFPGEVFQLPKSEALRLVAERPKAFQLESEYQAKMERLKRTPQAQEAMRHEYARLLEQRDREAEQADRLRLMIAERDQRIAEESRMRAVAAQESRAASANSSAVESQLSEILARLSAQEAESKARAEQDRQRIAELEAKLAAAPVAAPIAPPADESKPEAPQGRGRRGGIS